MKHLLYPLTIAFSAALLAGCPQSKVPDPPPLVPQPKAGFHVPGKTGTVQRSVQDSLPGGQWRLSRIAAL